MPGYITARRLTKRAGWLPAGAREMMDLRQGRYWVGRKARASLMDAFSAAGFTFARASQASRSNAAGLLVYEADGAPRLDYHPATLAPLGLLLERAMTPLIANGEALDNAYWTKNLCAVSPNQDAAPDGTATGDRMIPNATTSSGIRISNATVVTLTSGTRYALSGFAKPDGAFGVPHVTFGFDYSVLWHAGWYSLQQRAAGVVQQGGPSPQTMVREGGNGWLRCLFSHVTTATAQRVGVAPSASNGVLGFAGDGSKYASIWGMQLEQGDFPTSYNAGVARSADSLTRPIVTPDHFVRVIGFTAPVGLSTNVVWQLDDGTPANRVRLVRDNDGMVRLIVTLASVETVNIALGTVANESFNRVAIAYDGAAFRVVMNAAATVQTAVAAMPPVTIERLGTSATAGEELCGWLGEFTTYDSLADGGLREASRVFPSWVPTDSANAPADIFIDYVNGRFWANGQVYDSLATFHAGIGATVYGDADWTMPWTSGAFAAVIKGLAGSAKAAGANFQFLSVDDGAGGKYERIYLSGALNGLGVSGHWGAPYFGYENPTLYPKFAGFRVAVNFKTNDFSVSFEGGAPYLDTAGTVLTPTTLRIGNNYGRSQPVVDGEIWKVTIFKAPKTSAEIQALADARYPIIVAGDSYVGGAGNVGLPMSIGRLRRRLVLNTGVGGSTLASQVSIATAAIAAWPAAVFVHWDGDDNGFAADIADDLANYTTMVNAVLANGHGRYVIVAPMPRGGQSAAQRQRCRDLYTALAAAYPGHVVDPLPIVLTLADPVADAADIAANQCPSSQMQDGVHLKQAAMDLVATTGVLPIIDAGGWMPAE